MPRGKALAKSEMPVDAVDQNEPQENGKIVTKIPRGRGAKKINEKVENGITAAVKSKNGRQNKKAKDVAEMVVSKESVEKGAAKQKDVNAIMENGALPIKEEQIEEPLIDDGEEAVAPAATKTPNKRGRKGSKAVSTKVKEETNANLPTETEPSTNGDEDPAPHVSKQPPAKRGKKGAKPMNVDVVKEENVEDQQIETKSLTNGGEELVAVAATKPPNKRGKKEAKQIKKNDGNEEEDAGLRIEIKAAPRSKPATKRGQKGANVVSNASAKRNKINDDAAVDAIPEKESSNDPPNKRSRKVAKPLTKGATEKQKINAPSAEKEQPTVSTSSALEENILEQEEQATKMTPAKGRKRKIEQKQINDNVKEENEEIPKKETKRGRSKKNVAVAVAEPEPEPPIDEIPKKKTKNEVQISRKRAPKNDIAKKDEISTADEQKTESTTKSSAKQTSRKRVAAVAKPPTDVVKENESEETKPKKSKKVPMNATETIYNKADFELSVPIVDGGNSSNISSNGSEHPRSNLKISSWNVAGLRSWLKKGGLKFIEFEEPDIFCLQETKCTTDQLPEEMARIPGYHPYWLCMPGGYAGVALYSKIMPINIDYGIGNEEFDQVGRLITAEYEKFYLVNVYVPNSGRGLVNLEARMRWETLFQGHVKKLDSRKPVIITGDMNVSHKEIDLANPKTNTKSAGFTIEERNKMTELLALGFVDTFRHLYPDKKGAYTYWTYMANARSRNVGWRLDYFLVSERILKRVIENVIRSQCMGSDHCPITLFINI